MAAPSLHKPQVRFYKIFILIFHMKDGVLEYYAKMSDLEEELQGQFCRVHKGYLVNLSSFTLPSLLCRPLKNLGKPPFVNGLQQILEVVLYACCLTAFFYPYMAGRKRGHPADIIKMLTVFASYSIIYFFNMAVSMGALVSMFSVIVLLTLAAKCGHRHYPYQHRVLLIKLYGQLPRSHNQNPE